MCRTQMVRPTLPDPKVRPTLPDPKGSGLHCTCPKDRTCVSLRTRSTARNPSRGSGPCPPQLRNCDTQRCHRGPIRAPGDDRPHGNGWDRTWHGCCGSPPVRKTLLVKVPSFLGPAIRGHKRLFVVAVVTLCVSMWTAAAASAWFIHDIVTGLPDNAIHPPGGHDGPGDAASGSAREARLHDLPRTTHRRAPLGHLAPRDSGNRGDRGSAFLRSQWRRSRAHPRSGVEQRSRGEAGAGWQYAYAAARPPELSEA